MGINPLIQIIVYLLVGALVIYVAAWIAGRAQLPQPVRNIILAIVTIVLLLWLLTTFGVV
jgi:uncharacterized membrane protein YeaQ/YmgE (transglycosylase-associated protein family)